MPNASDAVLITSCLVAGAIAITAMVTHQDGMIAGPIAAYIAGYGTKYAVDQKRARKR